MNGTEAPEVMRSLGRIEAGLSALDRRMTETQKQVAASEVRAGLVAEATANRVRSLEVSRSYLKGTLAAVSAVVAFVATKLPWSP